MRLIHEKIQPASYPDSKAVLTGYVSDNCISADRNRLHPAILNLPGGGYEHISLREGEPVCLSYAAEGIHAFNLTYSVHPFAVYPQPLLEALTALQYIREHAEEYHIDPANIAVGGFSAGGHLALLTAAFWQDAAIQQSLGHPGTGIRPNKLVLSYPVVTGGIYRHEGSFRHLLGEKAQDPAVLEYFSMEKQITDDFPPVFLWHTDTDLSVPVENSLLLALALKEKQIPMELHIYPEGPHGLSLGNYVANHGVEWEHPCSCHTWIRDAVRFLYE